MICFLCGTYCSNPEPEHRLTARELTILRGIAKGWRNKTIAADLGVSDGTVECNVGHIYKKLPRPVDINADLRLSAALWWKEHEELHPIAEQLRLAMRKTKAA